MDLLEDRELARQVYALEDRKERWQLLSSRGYDFTEGEWNEVQRDAQRIIEAAGELSDEDPESVSGGVTFSPNT
ncbi:MAG: Nif11-like leader peptide family natural product precursor [Acidobacteria bacterium]|nr:MAG: Nif11-like leader peptide family natural product precursor [Acidobacteriota bacterium]REK08378.1 MAG: Nif11-like leader peptide family natural product precursor [Acidobacteriota bacterium]